MRLRWSALGGHVLTQRALRETPRASPRETEDRRSAAEGSRRLGKQPRCEGTDNTSNRHFMKVEGRFVWEREAKKRKEVEEGRVLEQGGREASAAGSPAELIRAKVTG